MMKVLTRSFTERRQVMKIFSFLLIVFITVSCSSEKISLSPVYDNLSSSNSVSIKKFPDKFNEKTGQIFYTSELSSQISTFPKFENTALNKEVSKLKYHIKEYVYAIEAYNLVGQENSIGEIEKSYRKIQKLRKFLKPKDDDVINRYLVRIKSNITQLESIKKDTIK